MAPPAPLPSLSAAAPVFRPTFASHTSSPAASSLLFLPGQKQTEALLARRRHSDFPTSLPAQNPALSFKTPQLGSAALYDPDDEEHSPLPSSASGGSSGRTDSLWGSPFSELSEVAPGTPEDDRSRALFNMESLDATLPLRGDLTVQAMAKKIAELTNQLASSADQLDALRAENYTLKSVLPAGGGPNMERRGSTISQRAERAIAMEAAFKGIPPPVQTLPGGKLVRPPPEIAQDILLGTMDYKDLLAMPGPHAPVVQLPIDTYTLRIQWIVAVLAGEFPAKEGALRRAAGALTDILNNEKRFSRRVVALLNVLATAASALAVRPQGNYLIQSAFACGREVRQAFFDIMQPDFKTIIPAQYGQHVVLKMIVRDDMRAWFVDQLVVLLGDRAFLQTRGGTRVLEQAFKCFSREQCKLVYDKLAEVMNGHWLECAVSINGCLVVQNLIDLYPHNNDFSHSFLDEVFAGITQVAINSHGSFVLHKLLIHPTLRPLTLLAIFHSSSPLSAGPDVGRDALLEGAKSASSIDWANWVSSICEGTTRVPSLVEAVQRPGGHGLLACALKEVPVGLREKIRATLGENARLLGCTASGREALAILNGSGGAHASPAASYQHNFGRSPGAGLRALAESAAEVGVVGSGKGVYGAGVGLDQLGLRRASVEPQMRWGMVLGGRRV